MMSAKFCALFTLLLFLYSHSPLAKDLKCSDRVHWPLGSCPDGDYWACWNNELDRNRTCSVTKLDEYPYRAWENYIHVQVGGLFSVIGVRPECFCCRLENCPYPEIGNIRESSPISSGKESACSMILDCVLCLLASCYYVDTGTGTKSEWRCVKSLAGLSSVKITVGGHSSKICPDATTSTLITVANNSDVVTATTEQANSTDSRFGLVLLICLATLAFGLVAFLWFRARRNTKDTLLNCLNGVQVRRNGNDNAVEVLEDERIEMDGFNGQPEVIQTTPRPAGCYTKSGRLSQRTNFFKSQ